MKDNQVKVQNRPLARPGGRYKIMAEKVMVPIVAMLIGAVMIAVGLLFAASLSPGLGIVLDIGGVATVIVGMVMLFNLARTRE
jgi:hypothetical protein